ncbi:hypothetical protein SVIOM342S_03718 [Streptomyces violaceorubidus]
MRDAVLRPRRRGGAPCGAGRTAGAGLRPGYDGAAGPRRRPAHALRGARREREAVARREPAAPPRHVLWVAVRPLSRRTERHWASDSPKARRPHPRCSASECATPSAAASGSPATVTSSAPSSVRCAAPRCRWRTRRGSRRTRRCRTPMPHPPARAVRRSTWRSRSPRPRDPERLRLLLDESLPAGLDVVEAVEARTSGLADRLTASVWELRLDGVEPAEAEPRGRRVQRGRGGRGAAPDQERRPDLRRPRRGRATLRAHHARFTG